MWKVNLLKSIQGIRKRPTYGTDLKIPLFGRGGISEDLKSTIDHRLIQCIRGFCSSPLSIFKLSLQVP